MNPVLDASGALSLSVPIVLVHEDDDENESGRTPTRGTVARLPENAEDLNAPSGLNAWTSTPVNTDRVREVIVTDPLTGARDTYLVLSEEPVGGALYSSVAWRTTRYGLREVSLGAPMMIDFSELDFAAADFN